MHSTPHKLRGHRLARAQRGASMTETMIALPLLILFVMLSLIHI